MIDDSIKSLSDFIKNQISQGYTWNEISKLTLADLKLMDYVFEEKQTTIDKAFPFLFQERRLNNDPIIRTFGSNCQFGY